MFGAYLKTTYTYGKRMWTSQKKKLSRKYNNGQTNDNNRCFATSVCHSSIVVKVSSVCIIWWRGSGQRVQSIHQVSKLALDVAD